MKNNVKEFIAELFTKKARNDDNSTTLAHALQKDIQTAFKGESKFLMELLQNADDEAAANDEKDQVGFEIKFSISCTQNPDEKKQPALPDPVQKLQPSLPVKKSINLWAQEQVIAHLMRLYSEKYAFSSRKIDESKNTYILSNVDNNNNKVEITWFKMNGAIKEKGKLPIRIIKTNCESEQEVKSEKWVLVKSSTQENPSYFNLSRNRVEILRQHGDRCRLFHVVCHDNNKVGKITSFKNPAKKIDDGELLTTKFVIKM